MSKKVNRWLEKRNKELVDKSEEEVVGYVGCVVFFVFVRFFGFVALFGLFRLFGFVG